MKILITNHHLNNYAGSELFTLNIAKSLKEEGHEVFVFSFVLGYVSQKVEKLGIPVTDNLDNFKLEKFDIIHAQHNTTAIISRIFFPDTPMILMVHGVVPDLEQPPLIDINISSFIVISDGVRQHLIDKYKISKKKICMAKNFVDERIFYLQKPVNSKLKKYLLLATIMKRTSVRIHRVVYISSG